MSLEEAIKHAEEVAEEKMQQAGFDTDNESYRMSESEKADCIKCAEEHEQLAEWLKELKRVREQTRWIPCSERLPEEDDLTQVLVSVNERYRFYNIILLPSKSVKTEYKLGHIDAWMPLPDPYRKEEQDEDGN